jgi:hypothetical protein
MLYNVNVQQKLTCRAPLVTTAITDLIVALKCVPSMKFVMLTGVMQAQKCNNFAPKFRYLTEADHPQDEQRLLGGWPNTQMLE